ncbi:MAG: hypothetical protein OXR66_09190 [Candidatus Woesearchaeota archaeon]|nr:hypothetical protein [Candidatus Woesearchaeota archaeon]
MVVSGLSAIVHEVQLAEELLTETFHMEHDPKVLLQVVKHTSNALEGAAEITALSKKMEALRALCAHILQEFKESPQVFARKEKLAIASEGFEHIEILNEESVTSILNESKELIYQLTKVMTCQTQQKA